MNASWSKIAAIGAGCLLTLAFASGCAESHDPDSMKMDNGSGDSPKQSGQVPSDSGGNEDDTDSSPEPTPDVQPVEVCGEIRSADVVDALELPEDVTVDDEDVAPDASSEKTPGFGCLYSWGDNPLTDQVTVSVVPETGKKGAQRAFTDVIGDNAEPYDDVGDVAGFDRSGRFGPKTLAFVTVAKTERGLSSVTVLGHSKQSEDGHAALAKKLLNALGS